MFSEIKLFQVKPDKIAEFEALIAAIRDSQRQGYLPAVDYAV